jgi:hypothetical protein
MASRQIDLSVRTCTPGWQAACVASVDAIAGAARSPAIPAMCWRRQEPALRARDRCSFVGAAIIGLQARPAEGARFRRQEIEIHGPSPSN